MPLDTFLAFESVRTGAITDNKLTAVLPGWGDFSDASLAKKLILVLVWWKRDCDLEKAGVSPLESANSGVGLLEKKMNTGVRKSLY